MHENSQNPATGIARSKSIAKHQIIPPPCEVSPASEPSARTISAASFDDTAHSLSSLRKLQDSSKFDKARFSFRLYKR